MDKLLYGHNESSSRLEKELNEHKVGIEYPNATNERGYAPRNHESHYRERHAHGDMISGESSVPGRGGSHMESYYGKPQHGRVEGDRRKNAVSQAHAENHRRGDIVGTLKRHEKDEIRELKKLEKKHCSPKKQHREHHAYGDSVGNSYYAEGDLIGNNNETFSPSSSISSPTPVAMRKNQSLHNGPFGGMKRQNNLFRKQPSAPMSAQTPSQYGQGPVSEETMYRGGQAHHMSQGGKSRNY